MASTQPYHIKTITEYHRILGCSKPEHPLISVINLEAFKPAAANAQVSVIFDFYIISLKKNTGGHVTYNYGQQHYDFDEGTMFFIAPGQVFSFEADASFSTTGWMLLIHPDFTWNTSLSRTIRQYGYFGYSVNEALHLSEKEETVIAGIIKNIEHEYHANIDKFSQKIIITQIETLLSYADRFYNRQFITREKASHQVLERLEELLCAYFDGKEVPENGIPTVQYISDTLGLSPKYLTNLLTMLTGQNTLQHIQNKVIEKAKEKLSNTSLSVGEIAYALGFEHSQSFSRLFKNKTTLSPVQFRQSFN